MSIGPHQYFTPRGRTPDQVDVSNFLRVFCGGRLAPLGARLRSVVRVHVALCWGGRAVIPKESMFRCADRPRHDTSQDSCNAG